MRKITINGVDFELTIPRNTVNPVCGVFGTNEDIFHWYQRPSIYKVNIWEEWLQWATETEGIMVFEITSANCNTFAIKGIYMDENGQAYNLWITKAHNRAIKVG